MPLFSKTNEEADESNSRSNANNGSSTGATNDEHPPNETTRLLPNRTDSREPYRLSPDDPAVSPYNLWSVRVLRYLTILFTVVTFVWWLLILVSAFATPPGFHTRGSGFFAFSYASLTLANMGFTLVFFGVPSKSVRILAVVTAAILTLDMILLLSVQQTRFEEGWVGVVSVVWALLMSLWTLLTDRVVKWGKAEEEERLTGRAETRRTLTEWVEVLLFTVAYTIMLIAVILITLTIILRALDAGVATPGTRYWVDSHKYQIHLYCRGNETDSAGKKVPTVLFEAGEKPFEGTLWDFADAAINNGSIARYCYSDRPGFAFSDTAPSPLSATFAVDVLSEALAAANETGPWVLASAGIGSIYSRVFSSRHAADVRGLLLIDPLHEKLLGEIANPGRGFLLWLRGVISPLGLDRLPGAIFKGRTSKDRVFGRSVQQTGKYIFARFQESLVADSFTRRDVEGARQIQPKDTPLVVISSGKMIKDRDQWQKLQKDLTKLTDNLKSWDIVDDAPHQVWEALDGRNKIEKRLKQLVRG